MARRRVTRQSHQERINDVLYHIHAHLGERLDIERLAELSCYSSYHFQRTFKAHCGESVHDYIRRARLEWAANLLIFNPDSTVMAIANECGFQSNASFSHAFRQRFGVSPSAWRDGGYQQQVRDLKGDWVSAEQNPNRHYHQRTSDESEATTDLEVAIQRREPLRVAYIRHTGYDQSIETTWLKLIDWADTRGLALSDVRMVGLYHSNPDIIPYEECRYVACLSVPDEIYRGAGVDVMEIPGGLFAAARGQGRYGDLIYLMHRLYHHWLPDSDYETINIPAHAQYYKNHFLEPDGEFDVELRIPVRFKC
ncbi:MAG: AraC family transcriptional regulator [Chromatiales bacterium]|nr:AraC family transcriptional regulator [Chromatiales bacterium]